MKLYGKRVIKKARERAIDFKKETRDGIVWSVDTTNRKVTIKIQGSNNQITAWFPANWHSPPPWCKYGNPIKIMHTSGHRGRIEIVGNGLIIPNPVTGDLWPADPLAENRILEGLQVLAMPNVPGNKVMVTIGTARIEGVIVEVGPISLEDADNWNLEDGGWLGQVAAVLDANGMVQPMPATFPEWGYRIHSVQLDQNGVITLTAGDQFEAYNNGDIVMYGGAPLPPDASLDNLPKPSVPFGSIELGTVLRYENQTIIQNFDINYDLINTSPWSRYGRQPTRLGVALEMSVMEWTDSTCDIDITCYDNLEQLMYFSNVSLQASIIQGNGKLKDRVYGDTWQTTITAHQWVDGGISYPNWYLQYKRDQLATDESPLIELRLIINNELLTYTAITLLDASGDPM